MGVRALVLPLALVLVVAAAAAAQPVVPGGGPTPGLTGEARLGPFGGVYWPKLQDVDYTYPSVTGHENQTFNLFLPNTPEPPGGYPVVVNVIFQGFVDTDRYLRIDAQKALSANGVSTNTAGFYWNCLEAGIALVSASVTVSAGGQTANQPASAFNGGQPGGGVFFPPNATYGGVVQPFEDLGRPMAEKDALMLVQYLRLNAASLSIDPDRMFAEGFSAATSVLAFAALGPDRAGMLDTSPHGVQSTRMAGALFRSGGPILWATFNSPIVRGQHFADSTLGAPVYDQPVLFLDETWPELLIDSSFESMDLVADGTFALNDTLPTFLVFDQPSVTNDFVEPYTLGTEVNLHSALTGYAWETRHPNATFLVVKNTIANGLQDMTVVGGVNSPEVGDVMFDWLVATLGL